MTLAEKLLLGASASASAKSKAYVEFVSSTAMTITPKYTNPGVTLQYSLNGSTWTTITSGSATPSANIIYFRGQATGTKSLFNSSANTNFWTFTGATNLECKGKLDRLLQNTLGSDVDVLTIGAYCFAWMFRNNTSLIKAPSLPATTLASNCYYNMFVNCTGLTKAPELPATTLASNCYHGMFGVTGLTKAPSLPATTLAMGCYHTMFGGCANLVTLPALPATTLMADCYAYMFSTCKGIKLSQSLTGIYDTAFRIPKTGTGTTGTNALANMFYETGGTFTGTPSINKTYYTENTPV